MVIAKIKNYKIKCHIKIHKFKGKKKKKTEIFDIGFEKVDFMKGKYFIWENFKAYDSFRKKFRIVLSEIMKCTNALNTKIKKLIKKSSTIFFI